MRSDGRGAEQLREVVIVSGVNPYAEGSVEVSFGRTKLMITASVLQKVPAWMENRPGGWITAEYGMLPRSTHTRSTREASDGRQGGRTLEIQRLIGRSLRAAVDLSALGPITICLDCDVLAADGGTRVAAICGGWVALAQALKWAKKSGLARADLEINQVAAVSVGVVDGVSLLDLCYAEDSRADFDLNLVFDEVGELIEIQGTAEKQGINFPVLNRLVEMGLLGVRQIMEIQKQALRAC